jgi:hypothetical protein
MRRQLLLFAILSLATAADEWAQPFESYDRYLIPVYGRQWLPGTSTTYTVDTAAYSDHGFRFWPSGRTGSEESVPAGYRTLYLPARFPETSAAGRLVFIERPSRVFLDLKVASWRYVLVDRTIEWDFTLADIPVIPESRFLTGPSQIIGVPYRTYRNRYDGAPGPFPQVRVQFRHRLRIYDVDVRGNQEVIVRVHGPAGTIPLEKRVALSSRDGDDPSYPFYAEISIDPECVVNQGPVTCPSWDGRVEIEPLDPTLQYWAFVTSTHNLTHDIAVLTPE